MWSYVLVVVFVLDLSCFAHLSNKKIENQANYVMRLHNVSASANSAWLMVNSYHNKMQTLILNVSP